MVFQFLLIKLVKEMKKIALFFLAIIIWGFGCTHYSEKDILNVSQKQEFLLLANKKLPEWFNLKIIAETDGEFRLQMLQKRFTSEKKDTIGVYDLRGKVDTAYWGDWYADTLYLLYTPKTVKTGVIKLKYSID